MLVSYAWAPTGTSSTTSNPLLISPIRSRQGQAIKRKANRGTCTALHCIGIAATNGVWSRHITSRHVKSSHRGTKKKIFRYCKLDNLPRKITRLTSRHVTEQEQEQVSRSYIRSVARRPADRVRGIWHAVGTSRVRRAHVLCASHTLTLQGYPHMT